MKTILGTVSHALVFPSDADADITLFCRVDFEYTPRDPGDDVTPPTPEDYRIRSWSGNLHLRNDKGRAVGFTGHWRDRDAKAHDPIREMLEADVDLARKILAAGREKLQERVSA